MNEKYYVIAGNHKEFSEFMNWKITELWNKDQVFLSFSNFVYLEKVEQLQGLVNPHGWFVGTWKKRPNIQSLVGAIVSRCHSGPSDGLEKVIKEIRY